jgi:hypothetical protein
MAIPQNQDAPRIATPLNDQTAQTHRLARLVLAGFIFTFVTARILVIFIMDGKLPPQLYQLEEKGPT